MIDLKKILKEKGLIVGTDRTLKSLRLGRVKKVFLAKNCPESARKEIKRYAEVGKVEIEELNINGVELGVVCKKPYSVVVLSC